MPGDGIYRIPLELHEEPEGRYRVTSIAIPVLMAEGGSLREALEHMQGALLAAIAEDVPGEHGLTLYLIEAS